MVSQNTLSLHPSDKDMLGAYPELIETNMTHRDVVDFLRSLGGKRPVMRCTVDTLHFGSNNDEHPLPYISQWEAMLQKEYRLVPNVD